MKYSLILALLFSVLVATAQPANTIVTNPPEGNEYLLRRQIYGTFSNDVNLGKYVFNDHSLVILQNGYVITDEEFLLAFRSAKRADTSAAAKAKFLDQFILSKQKVFEAMEQNLDTTTAFKLEFLKYKQEKVTPYLNQGYSRLEAEALPEFKYFIRQYYDGMILFELMNKEVWSKANSDNGALRTFYNEHLDLYQGQSFEVSRTKVIHDYQAQLEKALEARVKEKFPFKTNAALAAKL
ncbi:MAG TPA: hypothetical protein VK826_03905 [Bacteroidia bacterium]|nr:hypothetical protein [Bacteroidia bacterium]